MSENKYIDPKQNPFIKTSEEEPEEISQNIDARAPFRRFDGTQEKINEAIKDKGCITVLDNNNEFAFYLTETDTGAKIEKEGGFLKMVSEATAEEMRLIQKTLKLSPSGKGDKGYN